jgi:glycosyltransferase involved in cell wall biosynthesis
MRILIVSDAWYPQINGVVRCLDTLGRELIRLGQEVFFITPQDFQSVPLPTYSEIRVALNPGPKIARLIEEAQPAAIHISTEGPLGWSARNYCLRAGLPFTTAFHTRFPEYIHARTGVPVSWGYSVLRRFHGPSSALMVGTERLRDQLAARGFTNLAIWTRGVDVEAFRPMEPAPLPEHLERPIQMYVGRVAVEKNIESFLKTAVPGSKVVVGSGPQMDELKKKYPDVHFTGPKRGEELTRHYNAADVFVFPSLTDTLGFVMLEALACGVPVAAYPVMGPLDVLGDHPVGVMDDDLNKAIEGALETPREACRQFALDYYSWEASARMFADNLAPFDPAQIARTPEVA